MTKYNEEQQKLLRLAAKKELIRMETILKDVETVSLLDSFKAKYNLCETVYKVVLCKHQEANKKTVNIEHLCVDMRQVPYALDFAGYKFEKELLNNLFGSKSKKGTTVKKLRDKVTHGLDQKAIAEIKRRKEELFGYMDSFLDAMKNFND